MNSGTNTHLLYHVVFSTKKREPLIHLASKQHLYQYLAGIIKQKGGLPVLINGTADHVHILAFLPKHISLSDMLQTLKGSSSFWYNKELAGNGRHLYWQEGYSIFTVSPAHLDHVKKYIFNQEQHHQTRDYESEMVEFERELRKYYNPDVRNG